MIVIKNVFGGSKVYIKNVFANAENLVVVYNGGEPISGGGGGGVTDHGALTGLADDDHTQYHNDARGDLRYAQLVHTHVKADITDFSDADYAPALGIDDNYVTDAEKTKLANLSGTNTGDQDLSGYALTSHTHAISDITDLQTNLNIARRHPSWQILNALGSTALFESHGRSRSEVSTSAVFTDGYVYYDAIYVDYAVTLTGVGFLQIIQGAYTADNYNGVGLYSYNGSGTWTLVASSTNDGNIWKGAANTIQKKAFSSPYAASVGIYLIASMYNSSAQTTAPTIGFYNAITSSAGFVNDFTNSAKSSAFNSGPLTALPSPTVLTSAMTQNTQQRYFFLY